MLRLLENFDAVFDLTRRVHGVPLRDLLEEAIAGLDEPCQDWGKQGRREERYCESGRFVSFFYRPHLFPGMDPKLRLAHELQYRLLPRNLPPEAPVSIAAVLESYCHLSGDLFGWEMLRSGRFLVWIADMAGHGIRAGLASAVLRVLIANLRQLDRLDSLMSELNRLLHDCIRPESDGLYTTLFAMTLDQDGCGVYGSAGHPSVLVRRADGRIETLDSIDRPIGLFPGTNYECRPVDLEQGARLLLYTDGLVESKGPNKEFFGTRRLRSLLDAEYSGPQAVTEAVYQAICEWQNIDELDDDVTFLAVQR